MNSFASRARVGGPPLVIALSAAACMLEPSNLPLPPELQGRVDPADVGPPDVEPAASAAPTIADSSLALKWLDRIPVEPHLLPLPVPGFPDAVVAPPWDSTDRRPLLVVLHGMGDRPEPHCEAWRTITGAYGFILCPRGDYDSARSRPDGPRYTLGGPLLASYIDAAIAALVDRYGDRVDAEGPLLAGFSLGAAEAALLAQDGAERFARVAVVEGGTDSWGQKAAHQFAAHGGRRVLFGCGSGWCTPGALPASSRIEAEGALARVTFADVGHHLTPPLQDALRAELPWFVEGDERWVAAFP